MTIRKIYLQIDEHGSNYSTGSDFLFETFHITEYISRDVYRQKLQYQDANKFLIYIESNKDDVEYEPIFRLVAFRSTMPYEEIAQFAGQARTERILKLIEDAGASCDALVPGLREAIIRSTASFRAGGYTNIWQFKKKRITGLGIAELICVLDRDAFTLTLSITTKGAEIFGKEILRTKPDSICYHHKFKDILIEGDNIVITDRFDEPFFSVSISDIRSAR
jgi:hypothetical protein